MNLLSSVLERIYTVIGLVQRELVVFVFKILRLICLGSTPPKNFCNKFLLPFIT